MLTRPDRRPAPWLGTLAWLALTLAVTGAICLALFAGPREARFAAESPPPARGLHLAEPWPGGAGAFRWTEPRAALDLPNPGGALLLRLQIAGGRPVAARLAGVVEAPLDLGPGPRTYTLLAPPQPGERVAVRLEAPPLTPPGEPRALGVQLGEVAVRGGGAPPLVTLAAALLGAAAAFGLLRVLLLPAGAALASVALLGALLGWHRWAGWPDARLAPPVAALVAAAAAALPARWLLPLAWGRWREAAPLRLGVGALVAWVAGLLAYGALALWNHLAIHPRLALDLGIYLEAGRAVLAGESAYPAPGPDLVIGVAFVYPPATLPLFTALAALDPGVLASLWVAVNALFFLLALLAIAVALPGPGSRGGLVALLALGLASGPVLESLAIGQINGLMLLGLALFSLGHVERRLAWAGDIGLAVVILIKLTPGLLLLWPLLRGDWPRLLRVGAALATLCLPSLLMYGLAPWVEFAALVPDLLRGVPRNPYNQAIVAVLSAVSPPGSAAAAVAAWAGRAASLALLGTYVLVCLRRREDSSGPALAYGVAVLTVASSLIWYHHLAFLAIPIAWLGLGGQAGRAGRSGAVLALALIQVTRLVEVALAAPPWTAVAGYLIVVVLLAASLLRAERSPLPAPGSLSA
ncbi:MAG TPA: glycosyltransferase family 87 protein [Chloroflexaceae bacterium]|nr:glycosyltransferase family 87 protein [Chloroflexaceae bacterium]